MNLRSALLASPSSYAFRVASRPSPAELEALREQCNRVVFLAARSLGLIKITPPAKSARR